MLTIARLKETCNNEQVLMILLSRLYFKTQSPGEVQDFIAKNTINWNLFYQVARAHQVASFIYQVVVSTNLQIDPACEKKLKQYTFHVSLNSLHQLKFVQHLQEELTRLGIQAIPYKGVCFASRYYQSMAQRESSDIDFLVGKDAIGNLRNYFHEKGYRAKQDVPADYLPYALTVFKELSFKTPADAMDINCSVEIQWKLLEGFVGDYLPFTALLPHVTTYTIAGYEQKGLTPTYDFLCIVSHHIIKDPLIRFKYLVDLACIASVGKDAIDHATVASVIKEYGYWKVFQESNTVIEDLLGIQVHPGTSMPLQHPQLLQHAIGFPLAERTESRNIQAMLLLARLQDGWRGNMKVKLRMLLYWILPNIDDINAFRLPVWCLPLLFVLRPFRLLYKYLFYKNETG